MTSLEDLQYLLKEVQNRLSSQIWKVAGLKQLELQIMQCATHEQAEEKPQPGFISCPPQENP
jgi:transcription termination factor NusB